MDGPQHSGNQLNASTHLEVAEQRVSDELLSKVTQDTKQDKSTLDTRCHKPVIDAAIQARQRVRDWTTELTDIV